MNGVSVVTARSVEGLRQRGWEVGVVAPRYPEDTGSALAPVTCDLLLELPSMPLPGYPDLRLSRVRAGSIRRAIGDFKPDLVHCATEFVIGRAGQRLAIEAGIPVVSSYHTDFSRYTVSYGVPWLRKPVARYLARYHRRSSRVYSPGRPAAEDLRRLEIEQVEVWGRGVDTARFHPDRRNEGAHGLPHPDPDCFTLLHVGRLAAEKGVDRIIEAFEAARSRWEDPTRWIRLVVAGRGPREDALRLAAGPRVTFLGNLDRDTELPALYASADAFLFASETETLGLVVLEAMASGLPVIAVPAGGVADHLRDGINGIAVPSNDPAAMADAILSMARNEPLRRGLAAGARATAEGLDWEQELDRLDASYREVIG